MHCSLNELEDAALTFPVLFQDVIYQVNRKPHDFILFCGNPCCVCSCSQLVWRERSSSLAFYTCLQVSDLTGNLVFTETVPLCSSSLWAQILGWSQREAELSWLGPQFLTGNGFCVCAVLCWWWLSLWKCRNNWSLFLNHFWHPRLR